MNNTNTIYFNYSNSYFLSALLKLGLSTLLSFLISIERELHSHPGGACTHILVGFGSCLFTMISVRIGNVYNSSNSDPARICAQIVSGMGFLGSATIFKSDNYVKGINTAANLWISAAISMSIGADLWELGLITAILTIIILIANNRYKRYRYGKLKKDDESEEDIELGNIDDNSLSRDPEDAPYGNENNISGD